jgi:hypothetical protein
LPRRTLFSVRHSCSHNRHFSSRISQPPFFKMDPKLASIIEQVKVDIITPTQQRDNAKQQEEVSRSFICEFKMESEHLIWLKKWQPILSQVCSLLLLQPA